MSGTAVVLGETGIRALTRQSLLLAGRVLRRTMRMPEVVLQTVVVPIALLFLLLAVFGEVVPQEPDATGRYADRLVVLMVLSAAVTGALGSGAALIAERQEGLLARFRSLPVHRAAPLAGRVLGDVVRSLIGAVALVAVGHLFGFRFSNGALSALGFLVVTAGYASGFSWMVTAVAIRARSYETLNALNPVFVLLLFVNGALVPVSAFPGVLQPLIRVAPHTGAVDTLVALSSGGPLAGPLLSVCLWSAALTLVFAPLSVRGFRRAGLA
jgi:ABC-2 type transport system permease protein